MFLIPTLLKKTIKFKRLNNKHVKQYQVFGLFKDNGYTDGIRRELLDTIDNPSVPNVESSSKILEYNQDVTWVLPEDLFTDSAHKFSVFLNDAILSPLNYKYNKYTRKLTIDTNLQPVTSNDKIRLDYYRDMITKTYVLEENCKIKVQPVFTDDYTYGNHNIIL